MASGSQRVQISVVSISVEEVELAETVDSTVPAEPMPAGGWPLLNSGPWEATPRKVAGRYLLGRHLGSGGFGSVYEAHDGVCDRQVAVKLVRVPSDRELQRFRYETTSLRMLQVPGVVRLLDDGIDQDEAFIVMELVAGEFFPAAGVPTPWSQLALPTVALLEAVARVHALGVVHRDLKPSNVLVDESGRLTVLDFGVSALRDVTPDDGAVVGTPAYLAPEQAIGTPVDLRADLYTIGVMLFEALSGRLPHDGATPRELMRAKVDMRAPRLQKVAPSVPRDVAQIVDWMLEQHPSDRPASAGEVIDALLGRETGDPIARRVEQLADGGLLTAERLKPIFAGPDIFLHIPSDAAELAISRAGTAADAVAAELGGWVRAGLAHCSNGTIEISRPSLARITALPFRRRSNLPVKVTSVEERDAVAWIALAGPRVRAPLLARAAGVEVATFEALVAGLVELGVVRASVEGGYSADAGLAAGAWPSPRVREAHRSLYSVLPAGDPARMPQAILAADAALIVAELDAFVAGAIRDGRVETARALLSEALRVLRREPDLTAQSKALVAMAELALTEATLPAYDQLLVEIGCMPSRTLMMERLAKLAKGAQLSELQDMDRALAMLDDAGHFGSPVLELRRRACKARAARYNLGRLIEVVDQSRSWAATAPPPATAHLKSWDGRIQYRQGRFDGAARAFLMAGASMESATARMLERLNAAAAMLETYRDFDELIPLAREIREEARELRNPMAEARAVWIERSALYRRGDDLEPDLEIIEAAEATGIPWQAGLLTFQEAAFAWRSRRPQSSTLFHRASSVSAAGGLESMAVLARLAAAISGHALSSPVDTLSSALAFAQRPSTPPGIAAQLAHAVALLDDRQHAAAAAIVEWAGARIPVDQHPLRRELFGLTECFG